MQVESRKERNATAWGRCSLLSRQKCPTDEIHAMCVRAKRGWGRLFIETETFSERETGERKEDQNHQCPERHHPRNVVHTIGVRFHPD